MNYFFQVLVLFKLYRDDFYIKKHKDRGTRTNITPLVLWKSHWCFRLLSFWLWALWGPSSAQLQKRLRPPQIWNGLIEFHLSSLKPWPISRTTICAHHTCPVSCSNEESDQDRPGHSIPMTFYLTCPRHGTSSIFLSGLPHGFNSTHVRFSKDAGLGKAETPMQARGLEFRRMNWRIREDALPQ